MTEAFGVRRCPGCGQLLLARDRCECADETVHVITDLGPADLPGQRVSAQMLGQHINLGDERVRIFYYDQEPA